MEACTARELASNACQTTQVCRTTHGSQYHMNAGSMAPHAGALLPFGSSEEASKPRSCLFAAQLSASRRSRASQGFRTSDATANNTASLIAWDKDVPFFMARRSLDAPARIVAVHGAGGSPSFSWRNSFEVETKLGCTVPVTVHPAQRSHTETERISTFQ